MATASEINKSAITLFRAKDYPGAEELYRQALLVDQNFFPAQLNLGILLFKMGRFDDAMKECSKAVALDPNHPSAHFHLGNAYYAKMWWEEALVEYDRVLQIDPNHVDVQFAIGGIFLNRGHREKAVECWQKFIAAAPPDSPKAQLAKGYITDSEVNKVKVGKYIAE
jgi:tetratricopeptide (TPR) repeat protein